MLCFCSSGAVAVAGSVAGAVILTTASAEKVFLLDAAAAANAVACTVTVLFW